MRDVFLYFFVFFVARPFGPDGDFGPPTLLLGFGPADGFGPDDGFGPLGLGPAGGFGPAGAAESVGGVDDGIVGWTFMISDSGSWGLTSGTTREPIIDSPACAR